MLVDLLRSNERRPGSSRRASSMRPAALFGAAVYLLIAAAPGVRLVVHEHAGDDRLHTHAERIQHSHRLTTSAAETRTRAAGHAHHATAHHESLDHHHGHHHGDPQHGHGHHHDDGEARPASDRPVGDALRVDDGDHRAHWHEDSPHGLVVVELPLLLVPLDCKAADPSPISSAAPRDAARPTRARGPPLRRTALDTSEI